MSDDAVAEYRAAGLVLFVATNGDDGWSGQLAEPNAKRADGPFATLERARDAVRQIKQSDGLTKPITVLIRGGKYYLTDTFALRAEDSGTQDCPITYTAYPGEEPILSGGRRLTNWKPYKDKIWQCAVPKAKGGKWKFRQLFCNGRRMTRARFPNIDPDKPAYAQWLHIEGPVEADGDRAFLYKPGTFEHHWSKPTEGEVVIWHRHEWWPATIPITSVDEEKRTIEIAHAGRPSDRAPCFLHKELRPNNRFAVENLLEELDQPGEWCLDCEEGVVYFWPPAPSAVEGIEDRIEDAETVVPVVSTLIDLEGRIWRPEKDGGFVSWVTVSGLTLTETLGGDSTTREGGEAFGPYFALPGRYCGEAIRLRLAEHCTIENNRIVNVGGNGVYVEAYAARNVIRANEIGHAGAHGVCLGGGRMRYPLQSWNLVHGSGGKGWHPVHNRVEDNHIHHGGVLHRYSVGILTGLADGNFFRHNLLEDLPNMGFVLGNCGYGRNYIEYNIIRRIALETNDTGAIHLFMDDEAVPERDGHVIRFNLISGAQGYRLDENGTPVKFTNSFGIYIDNFTSNCFVYGNIIARCSVGICLHNVKNNLIENNIVYDCPNVQVNVTRVHDPMPGFHCGNDMVRNIFCWTEPDPTLLSAYRWRDELFAEWDHNVFHGPGAGVYKLIFERTLEQMQMVTQDADEVLDLDGWRRIGFDEHSVVADPLFEDPANMDFRLKPDSPALKLGFVPIDVDRIGPRVPVRSTEQAAAPTDAAYDQSVAG